MLVPHAHALVHARSEQILGLPDCQKWTNNEVGYVGAHALVQPNIRTARSELIMK